MRFNGDINGDGVVTVINDIAGTNNTVFPLTQKARTASRVSREIWSLIFEAYGGWQFDDVNNTTDFPRARASTVANQKDYDLPDEALTIRSIEILDDTGTWYFLDPISEAELIKARQSENEFMSDGTKIAYYEPVGTSFKLYPTPTVSGSQNMRISFDRDIVSFLPTDTTRTPGWDSNLHPMLPFGVALDWLTIHPSQKYATVQARYNEYKKSLKRHYQSKFAEKYPPKVKVADNFSSYQ